MQSEAESTANHFWTRSKNNENVNDGESPRRPIAGGSVLVRKIDPHRPDIAQQVIDQELSYSHEDKAEELLHDFAVIGKHPRDTDTKGAVKPQSKPGVPRENSTLPSSQPFSKSSAKGKSSSEQRETLSSSKLRSSQGRGPQERKSPSELDDGNDRPVSTRTKRLKSKSKTINSMAEDYVASQRGNRNLDEDQIRKAARRAPIMARRPSLSDTSTSSDSSQQRRSDGKTMTSDGSNNEIRLRVDASAPLSLLFNDDMEGRTLRLIPAEGGMADLFIGQSQSKGPVYRSERGSTPVNKNQRRVVAPKTRRAEEIPQASQRRRESRANSTASENSSSNSLQAYIQPKSEENDSDGDQQVSRSSSNSRSSTSATQLQTGRSFSSDARSDDAPPPETKLNLNHPRRPTSRIRPVIVQQRDCTDPSCVKCGGNDFTDQHQSSTEVVQHRYSSSPPLYARQPTSYLQAPLIVSSAQMRTRRLSTTNPRPINSSTNHESSYGIPVTTQPEQTQTRRSSTSQPRLTSDYGQHVTRPPYTYPPPVPQPRLLEKDSAPLMSRGAKPALNARASSVYKQPLHDLEYREGDLGSSESPAQVLQCTEKTCSATFTGQYRHGAFARHMVRKHRRSTSPTSKNKSEGPSDSANTVSRNVNSSNKEGKASSGSLVGQPGMPLPASRPPGSDLTFTPEEDQLLIELKEVIKLRWKQIADFFPDRAVRKLKMRYYTNFEVESAITNAKNPYAKDCPEGMIADEKGKSLTMLSPEANMHASPIPDIAVNVDSDKHQEVRLLAPQSSERDISERMQSCVKDLEGLFQIQHRPSKNMRKKFAKNLGLPLKSVNNWFQTRRQDAQKTFNQAIWNKTAKAGMTDANFQVGIPLPVQTSSETQEYPRNTSADSPRNSKAVVIKDQQGRILDFSQPAALAKHNTSTSDSLHDMEIHVPKLFTQETPTTIPLAPNEGDELEEPLPISETWTSHSAQSSPMPSDTNTTSLEALADIGTSTTLLCNSEGCDAVFLGLDQKENLARHNKQNHHGTYPQYPCEDASCDSVYLRLDARLAHYKRDHPHLALELKTRLHRSSSSMTFDSAASAKSDDPSNKNQESSVQQETQSSFYSMHPLIHSWSSRTNSVFGPTTPPIAEVQIDDYDYDFGANEPVTKLHTAQPSTEFRRSTPLEKSVHDELTTKSPAHVTRSDGSVVGFHETIPSGLRPTDERWPSCAVCHRRLTRQEGAVFIEGPLPITEFIRCESCRAQFPFGKRIEVELNTQESFEDRSARHITQEDDDNMSVASSYAASVDSIFSIQSLASSASILSRASGYSATQIATTTKVLLSIFHEDRVLLPLYISAIDNPEIGPERLQRNLRRLFKVYAEHLGREASERLEYLASRLVLVKSAALAQSIVDKFKSGSTSPQLTSRKPYEESSADDDTDEETDVRLVNEDAFEDLAALREFLVKSEAFKILHAQVQAFVVPKPANVTVLKTIDKLGSRSKESMDCSLLSTEVQNRSAAKDWQRWREDVAHNVDAILNGTNVCFIIKTAFFLVIDAIMLSTDDLLVATGQLESSSGQGMVRLRWQCKCGDYMYSDVRELREGGIATLIAHMHRTSGIQVHAAPYVKNSGNQRYIAPHPTKWIRNAITKVTAAFRQSSKPASCLPQHNTACSATVASAANNNPSQQRVLHLLACMHRNRSRKVLQQDKIEGVTTDRTLLCFLRDQYMRHRGRFLHMISLKSVKGIFFVKFRLPIGGSVDVRHHNPCCVANPTAPTPCECIPPPPKVEPSPTAEYRCIPGPPATSPPIPPEYLSSLFTCPSDVHKDDTWILDQLPKRTCGELQGKIGQPAEGWGIYYQEGWDRDMITLLVFLIFLLASLLFGILWSRFEFDVQGAFGVSAYMVTASSILVTLIATRAEKMG
ncbi:Nn.00g034450.m01.CDS01 [Neocucurbitaria sp. VM-36]